jgi:hypothetical protein
MAMVYAATGTLVSAALAGIGAVLPDVMEMRGVLAHRTVTHWPYPYLVVTALLYVVACASLSYMAYFVFFIMVGCVCHLFEDCLSRGGIPWKTPYGSRKGFDLYVTRTSSEYLTVAVLFILSVTAMLGRGFLNNAYLMGEIKHSFRFLSGFLKTL